MSYTFLLLWAAATGANLHGNSFPKARGKLVQPNVLLSSEYNTQNLEEDPHPSAKSQREPKHTERTSVASSRGQRKTSNTVIDYNEQINCLSQLPWAVEGTVWVECAGDISVTSENSRSSFIQQRWKWCFRKTPLLRAFSKLCAIG